MRDLTDHHYAERRRPLREQLGGFMASLDLGRIVRGVQAYESLTDAQRVRAFESGLTAWLDSVLTMPPAVSPAPDWARITDTICDTIEAVIRHTSEADRSKYARELAELRAQLERATAANPPPANPPKK